MIRLHGPHWKRTVEAVHDWLLNENSTLWCSKDQIQELFQPNEKLYIISGTEEQAFLLEDNIWPLDKQQAASKVFVVPSDHFSYFTKNWKSVEHVLELIILLSAKSLAVTSKL